LTAVLDAWAVLALLRDEPSAGRVEELLFAEGALISSINLGEALYWIERECGQRAAGEQIDRLRPILAVEDPDWPLVSAAAHVKAGGGLSYADAFCVATAQRHHAKLYTGDPEILALGELVEVVDLSVREL
jgi:PIN domain nuclease of toxin-antitoxin system